MRYLASTDEVVQINKKFNGQNNHDTKPEIQIKSLITLNSILKNTNINEEVKALFVIVAI